MKSIEASLQTSSSVGYPQLATPASQNIAFTPYQIDDTDWIENNDEELEKFTDQYSLMPPPETPRKAPRTATQTTPGKQLNEGVSWSGGPKGNARDDVFSIPNTGVKGRGLFTSTGLHTPEITPVSERVRDFSIPQEPDSPLRGKSGRRPSIVDFSNDDEVVNPPPKDSQLATAILDDLRDLSIGLTKEAVHAVKCHCEKHMRKVQGIEKGRDISRQAVKKNEAKIAELQAQIDQLKADRETLNGVVRHLKQQQIQASQRQAAGL